jgi:hypothetical protein
MNNDFPLDAPTTKKAAGHLRANSNATAGQMRPCPGGMRALHPDGYVVYRKPGHHSPFWLHSETGYEAGFRTLDELADELRQRGVRTVYSLPQGGKAPQNSEDLTSDQATALLALVGQTERIQTRPILFLDLDDVLCLNDPYGGYDLLAPGKPADLYKKLFETASVRRLKEILDRASPKVVMTTSWLRFLDRAGFEGLFAQTGLGAVVGAFHEHWEAPQNAGETRLQAVERWLAQHHQGEPYAVLDDHLSGTDLAASVHDLLDRVVLCDENVGLLDEQREGVVAALTRPFVPLQRSP